MWLGGKKMQLVEVMRERMWVKEGDLLESEGQFEKAIDCL